MKYKITLEVINLELAEIRNEIEKLATCLAEFRGSL